MSYLSDILASEPWLAYRFTLAELEAARQPGVGYTAPAKRKLVMPKHTAKAELTGAAKKLHDQTVAEQEMFNREYAI